MFDLDDITFLENKIILKYDLRDVGNCYFKEKVAQVLYNCWLNNKADTRIVFYCLPLIKNVIATKHNLIFRMDRADLFQTLCLSTLESLKKYSPEKGRLFTFLTMNTNYRILDYYKLEKNPDLPIEEYDFPYDTKAVHELEDFVTFIGKLKLISGKTDARILTALEEVIACEINNPVRQNDIISLLAQKTKLPNFLVKVYYMKVIERYKHSVLE